MKVQSISSYNYHNNYNNRSLGEKECPKPCFQAMPKVLRKTLFPMSLITLFAAACTKLQPLPEQQDCGCNDCDTISINVGSNSSSSSSSSASASATVNMYFITPNGDTIIPTPGGDTIQPPTPNGNHYFDFFDFIYGPMVQPDSINNAFGQVWPVGNTSNGEHMGNDTINYATKWEVTYSYHNSKDTYPHPAREVYTVNEKETTPDKAVYDVAATYSMWNPNTEQHDLETYNYKCVKTKADMNGKPAVISTNTVKPGEPGEGIIPGYVCEVPEQEKTTIYKYDKAHSLLGEEINSVLKDENGKVYYNHKWYGGNEYVNVRVLEAKKPEDLNGKK